MPRLARKSHPLLHGLFTGLMFAACVNASIVGFYLVSVQIGGTGAGGVLGFVVLPVFSLLAMPWMLIAIDNLNLGGDWSWVVGLFGGIFLNGMILGMLCGVFYRLRQGRGPGS